MAAWFLSWPRKIYRVLYASGLSIALLAGCLVYLAERAGLTDGLNELAYIEGMRLKPESTVDDACVLLIYCDPSQYDDPVLMRRLLQHLHRLGASTVGATVPDCALAALRPEDLPPGMQLVLSEEGKPAGRERSSANVQPAVALVHPQHGVYIHHFGRTVDRRDHRLANTTARPTRSEIPSRVVDFAATREPWIAVRTRHDGRDSLEAIVAMRSGIARARIPTGRFLIDFRGGVGSLPHVTADVVLRNELTSEFVQGQTVLLGLAPDPLLPGVATPTTAGSQRMPILEFRGHALNTILNGSTIRIPHRSWEFCLDIVFALVCVTILRQSSVRSGATWMLILLTLVAGTAWVLLHHLHLWISVVSLLLAQLLSALLVMDQRLQTAAVAWKQLTQMGFSASPRYRNLPPMPIARDPWHDAALMVDELFDIQRAALLILPRHRRRLRLVHGLRCMAGDIQEPGRNIRRSPYAEVIEQRGAAIVDPARPFFRPRAQTRQYLVPLLHRGRPRGMLALEIATDALKQMKHFADQVRTVADELAELVARREKVQSIAQRESSWTRFLWTIPEQRTSAALERHLGLVNRRLSQCCRAIEESIIGDALYDTGGLVVSMNGIMFRQLQRDGLAPMELRLVELIDRLVLCGPERSREILRKVVLERAEQTLSVPSTASAPHRILLLRPLEAAAPVVDPAWFFEPFQLQGIQVQLTEGNLSQPLLGEDPVSRERTLQSIQKTLEELHALTSNRS